MWKSNCTLGEGVTWVKEHNSIYFVDIKKKRIFIFKTTNNKKKIIKIDKEIGFVVHIRNNIFILGLKNELRILNFKTNKIVKSIKIESHKPQNRLNDGKTDLSGKLWFGSMDKFERSIENGSLYCLDSKLNLNKVDTNYIIPNGPAFLSNNCFYHTDSRKKTIYKIKINKYLKIKNKTIFKKFLKKDGTPDGMIVDTKGNLWVCHYRGAKISVFNKKGKKIHNVDLPAKNITNCTFGGKNNSELFITSALKGMKKQDIKEYALSGSLFKIKTNVKGIMSKKYKLNI